MRKTNYFITSLLFFVHMTSIFGQQNKPVVNYLQVDGPIIFDKTSFHLAWTSHPASNFYKQEYIPKTEVLSKFNRMVLIDLVTGNQNLRDVVGAKISELKRMQQTNPVVNYEVMENKATGEIMLDFLLSQNSPDGRTIQILERNVYRYKKFTDRRGNAGVLLFGISTRSYGDEVNSFLTALKSNRKILIKSVSEFEMPHVVVSN